MWVELPKPDGTRLFLNLDLTFVFDEQPDKSVLAYSINGTPAPTGCTMEEIQSNIMAAEES